MNNSISRQESGFILRLPRPVTPQAWLEFHANELHPKLLKPAWSILEITSSDLMDEHAKILSRILERCSTDFCLDLEIHWH